ncbi:N-alpha-acetyltransferase 35 NatC auxiliary subunit [Entophlyctis luteolus]|nr:N-alpha-acetyltransferase 35 NatC auxiliary subunit [Entophlyctis luteolus]
MVQRSEFVDITALVDTATNGGSCPFRTQDPLICVARTDMGRSQILMAPNFSLYDAMMALEIMEPRMDSGMLLPSNPAPRWSVLHAQTIVRFTGGEILGIVDRLLSKTVSWLLGAHLSQTVFTCVLAHNPHACKSALVRTLIIALLKSTHKMKTIFESARVVEDDEFFGFLPHGFSLANEVADSEAFEDLMRAENSVQSQIRSMELGSSGELSTNDPEVVDGDELAAPVFFEDEIESDRRKQYLEAIIARIRFVKFFLSSLVYVAKQNHDSAKKCLAQCLVQINECKSSLNFSKDMGIAFDTLVNRKLMSDSPPRTVVEPESLDAAYESIRIIVEHILEVMNMLTASGSGEPGWDDVLTFIARFGSRKNRPGPLERSILVSSFTYDHKLHGRTRFHDVLVSSVIKAYPPTVDIFFAPTATPAMIECVREFSLNMAGEDESATTNAHPNQSFNLGLLERLIVVFGGYNRALVRRNMAKIARELESAQASLERFEAAMYAENVSVASEGEESHPFYFSSWIYQLKLWTLETYLLMGFEQELYSEFEYPMTSNLLERAKLFFDEGRQLCEFAEAFNKRFYTASTATVASSKVITSPASTGASEVINAATISADDTSAELRQLLRSCIDGSVTVAKLLGDGTAEIAWTRVLGERAGAGQRVFGYSEGGQWYINKI